MINFYFDMDIICIDKWCWVVCFFKMWLQVIEVVECGCIKFNGECIKFVYNVRNGDCLDIDNGLIEWEVLVIGIVDKCGLVVIVVIFYQEIEESIVCCVVLVECYCFFCEFLVEIKGCLIKCDCCLFDCFLF